MATIRRCELRGMRREVLQELSLLLLPQAPQLVVDVGGGDGGFAAEMGRWWGKKWVSIDKDLGQVLGSVGRRLGLAVAGDAAHIPIKFLPNRIGAVLFFNSIHQMGGCKQTLETWLSAIPRGWFLNIVTYDLECGDLWEMRFFPGLRKKFLLLPTRRMLAEACEVYGGKVVRIDEVVVQERLLNFKFFWWLLRRETSHLQSLGVIEFSVGMARTLAALARGWRKAETQDVRECAIVVEKE